MFLWGTSYISCLYDDLVAFNSIPVLLREPCKAMTTFSHVHCSVRLERRTPPWRRDLETHPSLVLDRWRTCRTRRPISTWRPRSTSWGRTASRAAAPGPRPWRQRPTPRYCCCYWPPSERKRRENVRPACDKNMKFAAMRAFQWLPSHTIFRPHTAECTHSNLTLPSPRPPPPTALRVWVSRSLEETSDKTRNSLVRFSPWGLFPYRNCPVSMWQSPMLWLSYNCSSASDLD